MWIISFGFLTVLRRGSWAKKMTKRICSSCEENKPFSDFYKSSPGVCKECKLGYNRKWKAENADQQKNNLRRSALRRNFGITIEQYDEMFDRQKGCCAICERHQDNFSKRLAVDHNHITGEIRGLLCNYCNHRVVGRHRDGDLLRKIADYVDQGVGWFVPKKKKQPKKRKTKNLRDGEGL